MMYTLKIEVPEEGCKGCSQLKKYEIDHNYYGEVSTTHFCSVFGTEIKNFHRCSECNARLEESEQDVRKYADFLVKEINQMSEETYINAITDFANVLKPKINQPGIVDQIAEMLKEKAQS